jgi:hypothetical protein
MHYHDTRPLERILGVSLLTDLAYVTSSVTILHPPCPDGMKEGGTPDGFVTRRSPPAVHALLTR